MQLLGNTKGRLFNKLAYTGATLVVLFFVLTASQCPEEGGGIGGGEPPEPPENQVIALEPTVDGMAMYHKQFDPAYYFFNRYTVDHYFVVGSTWDSDDWPHNPNCCSEPLYFVTLLRFDQAEIDQKNVQQAWLYLYGYDDTEVPDTGTSLSEPLQVDRIAADWDFATHFYDTISLPGFVTPGDTVELPLPIEPGVPGTAYAIDVISVTRPATPHAQGPHPAPNRMPPVGTVAVADGHQAQLDAGVYALHGLPDVGAEPFQGSRAELGPGAAQGTALWGVEPGDQGLSV